MGGRRRQPGRQAPLLRAPGPRRLAERRARRARPSRRQPSADALLFHVNFGVPEEYADGHIPAARYLDTNWLESPADWNRRSPAELDHALRSLGITADTTVVVYGRDTEGDANEKWPGRRAGQIAATRAALILRYAGVRDVRLLDGGYDWWVRDGHPVETTPRQPVSVPEFGSPIPAHPELIVDLPEAKAILADRDGAALVSVRTWKEHIGKVSGYNYIQPAGRIRGDVWGNCGTDAYHMQHYRNVDNTMRAYPEIVGQLGRGRDHRRQVGRVLLRDRVARQRDLVLRRPPGLGADRGLRRRLARVELGPGRQPDRRRRPDGAADVADPSEAGVVAA